MAEQTVEELKKELEIANKKIMACKSVIKVLLRESTNGRLEHQWDVERLTHQRDCIHAEAKRWKQEYKSMSKKFNAVSEISEVRLDMIDNLCDEIQRLDKIVYHKPF